MQRIFPTHRRGSFSLLSFLEAAAMIATLISLAVTSLFLAELSEHPD